MNDVLAYLADANPVRIEDLAPMSFPAVFKGKSRPGRRVAVAVAIAAAAASLIAVFVFPGSDSHQPSPVGGAADAVRPVPPQPIALSDASAALGGAPVIIPAQLNAADASATEWGGGTCLPTECVVTVTFPSQGVKIRYARFIPNIDPLPGYEVLIADDTTPDRRFVYLGDVPAYLFQDGESQGSRSEISFQIGETTVVIDARPAGGAFVTALAQSIAEQAKHPDMGYGTSPLADASKVFGGPVVLPDTSLVGPSDAASTVDTACYVPDVSGQFPECQVIVDFPAQSLMIRYLRGVHDSQPPPTSVLQKRYEAVVNHAQIGAQLLDLDGSPALYVPAQSSSTPWIEFFAGNVDTLVQGPFDQATLQSIAQSIVDRSK